MDEPVTKEIESHVFQVDPEPGSLRMVLMGILLVGVIGGYIIVSAIFGIAGCNLVGIFGGLAIGAISMHLSERFFKPRWSANRTLNASYTAIELRDNGKVNFSVDPTQETEILFWRFEIKRRHRVPKGWYVVALALEQRRLYLPVYTLVSPEHFNEMEQAYRFSVLRNKKEREDETRTNLRIAGQHRRLMAAESFRSVDGREMSFDDFKTFLRWLEDYFPEWMRTA